MVRHALTVAATLLCGCSFEPAFDEGYRCVPDLPCPDGTACVDGFCRSGPAPADSGPDAAFDAGTDLGCAGDPVLEERFDSTVIDESVWNVVSEGGGQVEVVDGILRVNPAGPSSSGGLWSDDPFDVSPGSVAVEVFEPDATENNFQALELMNAGVAVIAMHRYRNTLRVTLDDGTVTLAEEEWNGITNHLWRITVTNDEIIFDTSAGGGLWSQIIREASPDLGVNRIRLTAGNYEQDEPPPHGFDNLVLCGAE